jgi:NADH-quinone oxidoreductase subunit J
MGFELIIFFIVAIAAIVSAIAMVTRRNPLKSVLLLIVNFFCIAIVYLLLHAQFIAVIQVIVYAGAIMVLFLFVIMLLNLDDETAEQKKITPRSVIAYVLSAAILIEILITLGLPFAGSSQIINHEKAIEIGTVESIGRSLFTQYLFPFEITSALLLAAIIGVIVLAKKKLK